MYSIIQYCMTCEDAWRVLTHSHCSSFQINNFLSTFGSPQLPSEYEANPELLFYRITHLNHRQQYLIWAAAVTTAGRGNFSDKVTVEPAAKGESHNM